MIILDALCRVSSSQPRGKENFMKKRKIGPFQVSPVCLGCMNMGAVIQIC
jgi:hypothetical protein